MDPIYNCVIGACCPPAARQEALAKFLSAYTDEQSASACAEQMLKHFDLAPAGTLTAFVAEVARLARGADYKG